MTLVTFTLIRHAESKANASQENKIGGHNIETQLTERGKAQSEALGNYFMKNGVVFTAAYSSTAVRAKKTAEICFSKMGSELAVSIDDRLLEQSPGDWEGQSRDIYERKDVRLALDTDNWTYIPGDNIKGESQYMVAIRMKSWIKEKVAESMKKDIAQHIAVFTHGLAIKFLLAELLDLDRPTAYGKANPIENASITQLCYSDGELVTPLNMRNYKEHLM